ncbi:MAG: hypothetical protein ABGX22_22050, partial [Pirellulaceae bacterium]
PPWVKQVTRKTSRTIVFLFAGFSVMTLASGSLAADPQAADANGVAFFEAKIRPVFVSHCYEYHSSEWQVWSNTRYKQGRPRRS